MEISPANSLFSVFAILLLLPCLPSLFLIPKVRQNWSIAQELRILDREEPHTYRSIQRYLKSYLFHNPRMSAFFILIEY